MDGRLIVRRMQRLPYDDAMSVMSFLEVPGLLNVYAAALWGRRYARDELMQRQERGVLEQQMVDVVGNFPNATELDPSTTGYRWLSITDLSSGMERCSYIYSGTGGCSYINQATTSMLYSVVRGPFLATLRVPGLISFTFAVERTATHHTQIAPCHGTTLGTWANPVVLPTSYRTADNPPSYSTSVEMNECEWTVKMRGEVKIVNTVYTQTNHERKQRKTGMRLCIK